MMGSLEEILKLFYAFTGKVDAFKLSVYRQHLIEICCNFPICALLLVNPAAGQIGT